MKRLLIILASVIVLLGIGVGVYFYFFADKGSSLVVTDNPFSSAENIAGSEIVSGSVESPTNAGTEVAPRLIKISNGPVSLGISARNIVASSSIQEAGSTTPSVSDVSVRYIERASGNIYEYLAHKRSLSRISNKTLPGIQNATWLSNGSLAFVQFLTKETGSEYVATYMLPVSGDGGKFFEQNLEEVRVAGTSTILTLLSGTTGSVATLSKTDGTGARTLFSSVLSSLKVYTPRPDTFFASTKASLVLDGYGFQIGKTGGFTRILGPYRGLSILPSPSGKSVLYSYTEAGTYRLQVLDVATHTAITLPVATLVEKCVWSNDNLTVYCGVPTNFVGKLPDDWYQGSLSFADRIWKIDMTARIASLVIDPSEVGKVSLDAVSLTVDPSGDMLVFIDRITGSLWAYDL